MLSPYLPPRFSLCRHSICLIIYRINLHNTYITSLQLTQYKFKQGYSSIQIRIDPPISFSQHDVPEPAPNTFVASLSHTSVAQSSQPQYLYPIYPFLLDPIMMEIVDHILRCSDCHACPLLNPCHHLLMKKISCSGYFFTSLHHDR